MKAVIMRLVLVPLVMLTLFGAAEANVSTKRIALWNGMDLTGWTTFLGDVPVDHKSGWRVKDGVLRLDTKAGGYLKTEIKRPSARSTARGRLDSPAGLPRRCSRR